MLKSLLLLLTLVALPAGAATVQSPPPASATGALDYLLARGLKVNSRFSTPSDLTGYIGTIPGGKQVVFFIPKDGSVAIFGTMLDAYGHNLSRAYLREYQRGPLAAQTYQNLAAANWIATGAPNPDRIVYAFLDPNCPYCWQFWKAARKYYDQGLQVRYIIVAILGESSLGKAAAILAAENPRRALERNESGFSHHSGAIEPLHDISVKLKAEIVENNALMERFGFDGTPAMVWKTDDGAVKTQSGLPPAPILKKIFGVTDGGT